MHISKTCRVHFAFDLATPRRPVCLKLMRHRHQFAAEVAARLVDGVPLPAGTVVEMLGWHMRVGDGLADANGKAEQAERTPCRDHPGFAAYP